MADSSDKGPKRPRGRPADPPDKGLSPLDDIPQFEFVPRDLEAEKKDAADTKAGTKAKAPKTNSPLKGQ